MVAPLPTDLFHARLKASSLFKIAFIPASSNSRSSLLSISSFKNSPKDKLVSSAVDAAAKAVLKTAGFAAARAAPGTAPTPPNIAPRPAPPAAAVPTTPAAAAAEAGFNNCVIV